MILATAANDYYLAAIARQLGIDEIVATRFRWEGEHLLPVIEGENCYGPAKLAMIRAYLSERGLVRGDLHLRFFSDHLSDLPTFDWADEPIAVNPSRKLRARARERGWPILDWR